MILDYKQTEEEKMSSFQSIKIRPEDKKRWFRKLIELEPEMTLGQIALWFNKSVGQVWRDLIYTPLERPKLINAGYVEPSRIRGYRVVSCEGHDTLKVEDTGAIYSRAVENIFFRNTDGTFHNIWTDAGYIILEPL